MVQLIVGKKGKGKTKHLLERVNSEILKVSGTIVYLDKSTKHMFELNNKVRLIDVSQYPVQNGDEFVGFIIGIISQDHDLQQMYFDSFLQISETKSNDDLVKVIDKLSEISDKFQVDFVLSISEDEKLLPDILADKIVLSL